MTNALSTVTGEVPSAKGYRHTMPEMVSPRGVWLRTNIFQEGHMLHAITYMVAAGQTEVFRASVDLRPIARAVVRYHRGLHDAMGERDVEGDCIGCDDMRVGGLWSSIKKSVRSIGRSKLLKKVGRGAKSVLKSKVTGGVVMAASVVYPPVGAPALAAYTSANAAMNQYEQGKKVAKTMGRAAKNLRVYNKVRGKLRVGLFGSVRVRARAKVQLRAKLALARKRGATRRQRASIVAAARAKARAKARARAAKLSPETRRKVARVIVRGRRAKKVAKVVRRPKILTAVRKSQKRSKSVQTDFKRIAVMARYAQKPSAKIHARKMARIINIVAKNRARLRGVGSRLRGQKPAGVTGLVIDSRGRVLKGRFVMNAQAKGAVPNLILASKGKTMPGQFRRVGGCVGCF